MKVTILFTGLCLSLFDMHSTAQNYISVQAGKKIHSVNKTINTVTQIAAGQEMVMKSDLTINLDADVKRTSPDILLSLKVSRLQLKSEVLGNKTDFDSDNVEDREGQIGQILTTLIGKSFDVLLSTAGKLTNVQIPLDPAVEAAKSLFDDFDKFPRELFVAIPTRIKPGDTWVEDITIDEENKKKTDYTVVSVTNAIAILSFKGIELAKAKKSVEGMDAVVKGSSSFAGEVTVDVKLGIIKAKKVLIESRGTTEIMGHSLPFIPKKK